jgi:hypothetical protein
MIYIIKTVSNPSYMKIGFSENCVHTRLKSIQTGCMFDLVLLDIKRGNFVHEGIIHGSLKKFHVRGEWFLCNNESTSKLEETCIEYGIIQVNNPEIRIKRSPLKYSGLNNELTNKILALLKKGVTNKEIAKKLKINKCTVSRHKNDYSKRFARTS